MLVPCLHVRTRVLSCFPVWIAIVGWLVVCSDHDVAIGADANAVGAVSPDRLLLKDYRPRSIFKVPVNAVERARFPVIDMHSHAYARTEAEVDRWVRTMDAVGIEKTVVLTGATGQRFDDLTLLYGRHPDRFELWCGVDYSGFDQPGFGPAAVAELERCAQQGAKGVGELSDKGGGLVRNSGGMHLDDPRMDLILEKCAELGLPVNIHVGEDRWMYEPMDEHNDGLMNAFKWRIPESPDVLRHDAVIATLDRALQRHPRTTFIACHFANCCYDLSILGRMLDAHPNLHADISARFGETAPIPRTMRKFYEAHQDRLLYGTDMGYAPEMYRTTFRIIETEDEHFYAQDLFNYHWPLHGFGLPDAVLKKIYGDNARRILTASGLAAAASPDQGPLRIHPDNARYFTDGARLSDGSLRAVYLTGSHTWNNLVDMGRNDPPDEFDFDAYLEFLELHHHNFIRLWAWDSTVWDTRANGALGKDFIHNAAPLPWARTGPGNAFDGKPKFNLTKFDPVYFERLRSRVVAAGERGIYVSVMLFEGWGLFHGNRRRGTEDGWAWRNHPFNPANNVNGVNVEGADAFSGRVHTLRSPEVNKLQADYIRKVVETLNDLDNVLYEVINEGGEKDWNWWVIQTIHEYESSKPKQHPVGNTGHGAERVPSMLASPADWVSPGRQDGFAEEPPAWNENKVSLLDTDHIWGVGGNAAWVWKSFLRGHNPIFMDPYDGSVLGPEHDRGWDPIREAMGQNRRLAERVNLASLEPRNALATTGYCLANPGIEYVVYQPDPGESFSVDLKSGVYRFEWIDPIGAAAARDGQVEAAGGLQEFKTPLATDAVLFLKRTD